MFKVIAFDVFGTVFDLSQVPSDEVKAYLDHIRKPEWSPLVLPKSWETLPAHEDSRLGINLLRVKADESGSKRWRVVTLSNGPVELLRKLSSHNDIQWDSITPLENYKVFKPNPKAYMAVCEQFCVEPEEVLMVTANKKFGDLEASKSVGMQSILIRTPEIPTIVELYQKLAMQ